MHNDAHQIGHCKAKQQQIPLFLSAGEAATSEMV